MTDTIKEALDNLLKIVGYARDLQDNVLNYIVDHQEHMSTKLALIECEVKRIRSLVEKQTQVTEEPK